MKFYFVNRQKLKLGTTGELLMNDRIVIPRDYVTVILESYHDEIGHPGVGVMLRDVQSKYAWLGLRQSVYDYVAKCDYCQRNKPNNNPRNPPQKMTDTATRPHEKMAFHLTGPMPMTNSRKRFILCGVDLFSKRLYTEALPSKAASGVALAIERMILMNPVKPTSILTDNGGEFTGLDTHPLERLCDKYNIRHDRSSPYHPQSNGVVERMNQTLKSKLFAIQGGSWDSRLQFVTYEINRTPSSASGYSPFMIETGHSGSNPLDKLQTSDLLGDRENIWSSVRDNLVAEKSKRVGETSFKPFEVGDFVLVKNFVTKSPKYVGPFVVVQILADGYSYKVEEIDTKKRFVRRAEMLKLYNASGLDNQSTKEKETPDQGVNPQYSGWDVRFWDLDSEDEDDAQNQPITSTPDASFVERPLEISDVSGGEPLIANEAQASAVNQSSDISLSSGSDSSSAKQLSSSSSFEQIRDKWEKQSTASVDTQVEDASQKQCIPKTAVSKIIQVKLYRFLKDDLLRIADFFTVKVEKDSTMSNIRDAVKRKVNSEIPEHLKEGTEPLFPGILGTGTRSKQVRLVTDALQLPLRVKLRELYDEESDGRKKETGTD